VCLHIYTFESYSDAFNRLKVDFGFYSYSGSDGTDHPRVIFRTEKYDYDLSHIDRSENFVSWVSSTDGKLCMKRSSASGLNCFLSKDADCVGDFEYSIQVIL